MLILHHYAMSPFSEKIRLMLGYAGVPWQSLPSPEMPPRPNVDPLSGGYRRIPIAQIGADVFCDSRLISAEIARESGIPALDPCSCDEAGAQYAAYLESEIFWAAVLAIAPGVTIRQLFRNLGLWQTLRFIKDRAGVGRSARVPLPTAAEARATFAAHLQQLEQRLQNDYLCGDAPSYTDFAAYHTLWFRLVVGECPIPAELAAVQDWYQRMTAFGHGKTEQISRRQGFTSASDNAPRVIPASDTQDPRIGSPVSIRPADYALDAVAGRLVGSSAERWVIARDSGQFGLLHVHFPRDGFELA